MINNIKPESKNLVPKNFNDILSNQNRDIYVIEAEMQRPFVWGVQNIETWWGDIISLCEQNFEKRSKAPFDIAYMNSGTMDVSDLFPHNINKCINEPGIKIKSLVDASQRIRLSLATYAAFLLWKDKNSNEEYVDISPIKSSDGQFKLVEIGRSEISDFYKYLKNTPISNILKERSELAKWRNIFATDNKKRPLIDLFKYAVTYIEEHIVEKYSIKDCLWIFLNNVYIYEEQISVDDKYDRFLDRNDRHTPMSTEDMMSKFIINQYEDTYMESVYNSYVGFEEVAKDCDKNGAFIETKGHKKSLMFIMDEALKITLGEKGYSKPFKSNFTLKDSEFGIKSCLKNRFCLETYEDAISYFNECKRMAEFILYDSMKNHEDISDDCYYFRNFTKPNVVWWYFVKPAYIMNTKLEYEKRKYAKDLLFRSGYIIYCVVRAATKNTNSQNLINALEEVSYKMLKFKDAPLYEFKNEVRNVMYKYYQNMIKNEEDVNFAIKSLSYITPNDRKPLEKILISLEYELITKYQFSKEGFHKYWFYENGKPVVNLDHWYPENLSKETEDMKSTCSRIGNLCLLEGMINSSKGDDMKKNMEAYMSSEFKITNLMYQKCVIPSNIREKIKDKTEFKSYSYEEINSPKEELIKMRTDALSKFLMNFVKEPFNTF